MKRAIAVSTVFAVHLIAGVASAQTTTTQQQAPIAGRAPLGVTVIEMESVVVGWSVEKDLLDKRVMNDKKERIGKVEDLIIAPSKDMKVPHATFAIIGVGGFLGIATKDVAIPMEQLKLEGGNLILPGATKEALKGLPEFKYAKR